MIRSANGYCLLSIFICFYWQCYFKKQNSSNIIEYYLQTQSYCIFIVLVQWPREYFKGDLDIDYIWVLFHFVLVGV